MPNAVSFFERRFRAEGNPARAVGEKAYMKSALRFHGVDARQVRAAAADYCRAHPLDHDGLVGAVEALFATDWFDLRSAGIALLERQRRLVTPADADWLITLVRRAACWAHVDWLATKIVPRALPDRPARLLRAWARDEDLWVRRTALLAQLDALRAGGGDFGLFAGLAAPMLPEKEFFIRKAIGWVLRDVARKRPGLTFDFVAEHGAAMSGLTFREATRRLPAELRARLAPAEGGATSPPASGRASPRRAAPPSRGRRAGRAAPTGRAGG